MGKITRTNVSDLQGAVRLALQKGIEAHKDLFPQVGADDLAAMGGNVVFLQPGFNEAAVFLGIGPFAQPGVLQIGPLGHQNVRTETGIPLHHGIMTQGRTGRDRDGMLVLGPVKNFLKFRLLGIDEIDEMTLDRLAGQEIYIFFQYIR
jgi:hypothetical protein